MATRDRCSALGLALLAIAYLAAARRYPLDTLVTPGPGVFPLAVGVALLAVAAWMFVGRGRDAAPAAAEDGSPRRRTPLVLSAVLVLYAALLPAVGFAPASFALVVVTARLMGLPGWWRPLALGAGVMAATRLVFVTWLGVPLP
jgi:putative tricarboxylic transport membrane protein